MNYKTPYNKIIVCGMYRSGSTLLFNIIKYLCKEFNILNSSEKLLTTHKVHLDWTNQSIPQKWAFIKSSCEPDNLVIYSRRDIRDVICSYFKREQCSLEDFSHGGRDYMNFLKWVVNNDSLIDEESERNINIKILSYEHDIQGDEKLSPLINKTLSYFCTQDSSKDLNLDQFKFLTTKRRSDSLSKLDGSTQYWPNHLGDGKVCKYNSLLTKHQLNSIENDQILKPWINKHYP
jgi:hypothetical protein